MDDSFIGTVPAFLLPKCRKGFEDRKRKEGKASMKGRKARTGYLKRNPREDPCNSVPQKPGVGWRGNCSSMSIPVRQRTRRRVKV